jgi:hypothetical protein
MFSPTAHHNRYITMKNKPINALGAICFGLAILTPTISLPAHAGEANRVAQGTSVLPEETAIQLVTDLSDKLATQLAGSSCEEFNTLLDDAQTQAKTPQDDTSIIGSVLKDVRTNPKLRTIIMTKLSEPLLNKILDCNLVPLNALQ